jgi:DNA-binding transcriptional LysR family regulator
MPAPAQPTYSLDQLAAFLAVVDEGSFSAAGRRLGRVQSAISYGIAQLEAALGARLFERGGHIPALTDAGQRLSAEARLVLGQARELAECAARLHAGIEPELRLVVDVAFPTERLIEVCAAFRELFPITMLRLDVGLLNDPVESVRRGAADLAVCNLAWNTPRDLAVAYLGSVRIVPVCAPHHPLAKLRRPQRASALEQSIQIVHSERDPETHDQGVLAPRTWRVTDLALKVELIRAGIGWGSLPGGLAAPLIARKELVELSPEMWRPGGHQIWMHAVMRKDRTLGRAGQWMRDQLRLEDAAQPPPTPRPKPPAARARRGRRAS